MAGENGNGGRTFMGRVMAAATAMIPILVFAGALGIPYIRAEVRREWEPEMKAMVAAAEARADEKVADIKQWLVRISDKLDRLAEKR
jgi:hypothetical protein